MKDKRFMDKSRIVRFVILIGIILIIVVGISSRKYTSNYNFKEVSGEKDVKTYISDFHKDSVVDKSVGKLKNKLRNINTKQDLLDVLLKYYKDIIDEYFGEDSGSVCYNKVNNTINISIKSANISKEKLMESDYDIQNEWNLITSKMANFTRNTKGMINELTKYDINIQIDVVDIDTNEVVGTVRNGEIEYSVV